jgi:hypothetical protein
MITRSEAKTLLQEHPWESYTQFPADVRSDLLIRVNASLSAETIPVITARTLRWRMSILVRDFKKKKKPGMHT